MRSCLELKEHNASEEQSQLPAKTLCSNKNKKFCVGSANFPTTGTVIFRICFVSGACDPRCTFGIVMGRTSNSSAPRHKRHSMIIVPFDTPGVRKVRALEVFGYDGEQQHTLDDLQWTRFANDIKTLNCLFCRFTVRLCKSVAPTSVFSLRHSTEKIYILWYPVVNPHQFC